MAIGELKPGAIRGVFVQKQRANVYTMMLIVAFLFIMVANIFLYAEMGNYQWTVRVPPQDMPPADTHARWQPGPAPTFAYTRGLAHFAIGCEQNVPVPLSQATML